MPGKLLLLLQSKMSASLQYREIIQANLLQMAAPTSALGKDLMTRFELDSLARLICSDRSASIEANIVRVISPIANLI